MSAASIIPDAILAAVTLAIGIAVVLGKGHGGQP